MILSLVVFDGVVCFIMQRRDDCVVLMKIVLVYVNFCYQNNVFERNLAILNFNVNTHEHFY